MLVMAANNSIPFMCYVLGGIVLIGGAYFVYKTTTKENKKKNPPEKSTTNESSEITDKKTDEKIVQDILSIIKYFNGCLNSLNDIVNSDADGTERVTFENLHQIINAHGSNELKKWFISFASDRNQWDIELYKDKASKMLEIFRKCGINRSCEVKVKWNEQTSKHYKKISKIDDGQICEVLAPCWIYQNEIFEQGLVRAIEH